MSQSFSNLGKLRLQIVAFKTAVSSFSAQHFDLNVPLLKQSNKVTVPVPAAWHLGPRLLIGVKQVPNVLNPENEFDHFVYTKSKILSC